MRSAFVKNCSKASRVFVFTRLFPSLVKQFLQSLYFSVTSSLSFLILAADMARLQQVIRHSMVSEGVISTPRTVLSKRTKARFQTSQRTCRAEIQVDGTGVQEATYLG